MRADEVIETCILALCRSRGAGKTTRPSEVTRALEKDEADWRALMPSVRKVAGKLAKQGLIVVTQRGQVVDPEQARGPIRLGANVPPR